MNTTDREINRRDNTPMTIFHIEAPKYDRENETVYSWEDKQALYRMCCNAIKKAKIDYLKKLHQLETKLQDKREKEKVSHEEEDFLWNLSRTDPTMRGHIGKYRKRIQELEKKNQELEEEAHKNFWARIKAGEEETVPLEPPSTYGFSDEYAIGPWNAEG